MKEKAGAVLVVLLMLLPLAPIGLLAQGQVTQITGSVQVFTLVASGGSEITFAINVTALRQAPQWVAAQIDIYLDDNGFAQIDAESIRLTPAPLDISGIDYVVGTVRLPPASVILSTFTGITGGKLYIKVFGGPQLVAVSNPFIFLPSTAGIIEFNDDRYAYFTHPLFGANNTLNFTVNFTSVNSLLAAAGLTTIDLTRFNLTANITSDDGDQELNLYRRTTVPSESSEVISPITSSTTPAGDVLSVEGNITDFPLISPENQLPAGQTRGLLGVNFERFTMEFLVENETVDLSGNIIVVRAGAEEQRITGGMWSEDLILASLSYEGFIDIFPSAGFDPRPTPTGDVEPTISGPTDEVNVFDNITVELHNFPPNENISVTFYWFDPTAGTYTLVPGTGVFNATAMSGFTTGTNGAALIEVFVPGGQYGGRVVALQMGTFNTGFFLGLPTTNTTVIEPFIILAPFGADGSLLPDTETLTTPMSFAPNDYLLVKGHGFIQESIQVEARFTNGTLIGPLTPLLDFPDNDDVITVLSNGSFSTVMRAPPNALPSATTVNFFAAGTTATNNGTSRNPGSISYTPKVYVNATPEFMSFGNAQLMLGLFPAYPAPAVWEDPSTRFFTAEVIGLDAASYPSVFLNFSSAIFEETITPAVFTPSNGYLRFDGLPVPVVPYGDYDVEVVNATTNTMIVDTDPVSRVGVRNTIAAIDPLTGEFRGPATPLFLGGPQPFNVTGYGWHPNDDVFFDIAQAGVFGIFLVTTDGRGSFENATVQFDLFVLTSGTFTVNFTQPGTPMLWRALTVVVGVPPALEVMVEAGTIRFAGETVDLWLFVLFGDERATEDQISVIHIFVSAQVDGLGYVKVLTGAAAVPQFLEPGVWHLSFTVPPELAGEDLVVIGHAVGRYAPNFPDDEDWDTTIITVPGTLEDYLQSISGKVDQVLDALEEVNATIVDVVAAGVAEINTTVGMLIMDIEEMFGDVFTFLDAINATVVEIKREVMIIESAMGTFNMTLQELLDLAAETNTLVEDGFTTVLVTLSSVEDNVIEEVANAANFLASLIFFYGEETLFRLDMALDNQAEIIDMLAALNATIVGISEGVAAVQTSVGQVLVELDALEMALSDVNATIVGFVMDAEGNILAAIDTGTGQILAELDVLRRFIDREVVSGVDDIRATLSEIRAFLFAARTDLETAIGNVLASVRDLSNATASAFTDTFNRLASIENAISGVANAVGNVQDRVSTVDSKLDNVNNRLGTLDSKLDSLDAKVSQVGDDVKSTVQSTVQSASTDVRNAVTEAQSSIENRIDTAASQLASSQRTFGALNSVLTIIVLAAVIYLIVATRRT